MVLRGLGAVEESAEPRTAWAGQASEALALGDPVSEDQELVSEDRASEDQESEEVCQAERMRRQRVAPASRAWFQVLLEPCLEPGREARVAAEATVQAADHGTEPARAPG